MRPILPIVAVLALVLPPVAAAHEEARAFSRHAMVSLDTDVPTPRFGARHSGNWFHDRFPHGKEFTMRSTDGWGSPWLPRESSLLDGIRSMPTKHDGDPAHPGVQTLSLLVAALVAGRDTTAGTTLVADHSASGTKSFLLDLRSHPVTVTHAWNFSETWSLTWGPVSPVPEPGAWALMALGVAGAGWWGQRRRARRLGDVAA